MKRFWVTRALKGIAIAAIAVGFLGYLVMALWNWLLPSLAGWQAISFVQALGLLVLCRLLFGGVRGHRGWHWRRRMRERWEAMTPEEREQFRAGLGRHCRHAPTEAQPAPKTD